MEASVVIPSYRRPDMLARTLASCRAQRGVAFAWEIIVVDNDVSGSARPVAEAGANGPVPVRYVLEPRPGISHARNTGIAHAIGRYVLFLDDDEEAVPDWLAAFVATMRASGAAVAVGPVRPSFADESQPVDPFARRVFTRDAALPSGSPVPRWSGIGNAILLRARCFPGPAPFDPRLGLSGGEDAIFLGRLVRGGGQIVWCAEAGVVETIPAARLAPRYLLRRAFRGGQTTSFIHYAATPREVAPILRWMAIGCAQVLLYGPAGTALRLLRHPASLAVLAKAASGLGKIVWHPRLHLRLYR